MFIEEVDLDLRTTLFGVAATPANSYPDLPQVHGYELFGEVGPIGNLLPTNGGALNSNWK